MKTLYRKMTCGALLLAVLAAPVAPAVLGTAHAESLVKENSDRDSSLAAQGHAIDVAVPGSPRARSRFGFGR